jgi:hypothetical protein
MRGSRIRGQRTRSWTHCLDRYFVNDGVTNGSLPTRDTVSVPGARKRNEIVGRVESTYAISPDASVSLGLSAQHFQADLPPPVGEQAVTRLGADVNVSPVKGLSLYADYARQRGSMSSTTRRWELPRVAPIICSREQSLRQSPCCRSQDARGSRQPPRRCIAANDTLMIGSVHARTS